MYLTPPKSTVPSRPHRFAPTGQVPLSLPQKRYWIVGQTDTLSSIAFRVYKNPKEWVRIYNANPGINPNSVPVGTILLIP